VGDQRGRAKSALGSSPRRVRSCACVAAGLEGLHHRRLRPNLGTCAHDHRRSPSDPNSRARCSDVGHVGDGNFHVCFLVDPSVPEELAQVSAVADEIAERAIAVGGTCTGEHGVGYGKSMFLPLEYGDEGVELMQRVKSAIDPDAIMNPGKILPEP
jgi:FAD/FMN-containing dehydrogenase